MWGAHVLLQSIMRFSYNPSWGFLTIHHEVFMRVRWWIANTNGSCELAIEDLIWWLYKIYLKKADINNNIKSVKHAAFFRKVSRAGSIIVVFVVRHALPEENRTCVDNRSIRLPDDVFIVICTLGPDLKKDGLDVGVEGGVGVRSPNGGARVGFSPT